MNAQIDQIPAVACTERPKPSEDVPWWGWILMSPILLPIGAVVLAGVVLYAIRPASADPDFGLGIPGFGVTLGGNPDWNKP